MQGVPCWARRFGNVTLAAASHVAGLGAGWGVWRAGMKAMESHRLNGQHWGQGTQPIRVFDFCIFF